MSKVSLNGGLLEKVLCEAVKLKSGLTWRTQDVRNARVRVQVNHCKFEASTV